MKKRFWLVLAGSLLAFVSAQFFPSSAGAASPRHVYSLPGFQPQAAGDLLYNGGSVMNGTSQVYAIFWEPTGTKVSTNYNNLILRYLSDVGSSPLYHNNTQYTDSQGLFPSNATLGGS